MKNLQSHRKLLQQETSLHQNHFEKIINFVQVFLIPNFYTLKQQFGLCVMQKPLQFVVIFFFFFFFFSTANLDVLTKVACQISYIC